MNTSSSKNYFNILSSYSTESIKNDIKKDYNYEFAKVTEDTATSNTDNTAADTSTTTDDENKVTTLDTTTNSEKVKTTETKDNKSSFEKYKGLISASILLLIIIILVCVVISRKKKQQI